ncbi:Bug family tripartite tricarboxylate transporter substrate binding protein [Polynucleobacter kasalickyi]|uniref:Tripartite-type tricarboxylate transporter, receptor component TctC n=1 Tax=Polynucleobacter kasalickyi TaxID=1938817 RepID=A0A1W2A2V1_9BURK|nr:tripartite tricarboxylate transporter substrate binding protein [Polynucleobacter kasalickyi]SMC54771.1 Tripartite-type tricarboxylate transporter, receptor component TctC [Polynucleobacter kasalickyi]
MNNSHWKFRVAIGIFCAITSSLGVAQGNSYPNRPIKIVIPFPPGNTTDIMTRMIAPKLQEAMGQAIVVENRAGASGTIGMDFVAKSKPDGYTIVASQGGNMVVLPHTSKTIPYNPIKDFAPISLSTANYLVVISNKDVPFKTVGEMIAWAKANPGKLTVGSNGEGGFPHLTFEHLAKAGDFTFTHVPYKGSAAVITDMAGGQVMLGIDGVSGPTPHIRSGLIKLLAVTNKVRVKDWPNTPAVAETLTGWDSNGWFGYSAPAGTPKEIVQRLNTEINKAMRSPEIVEQMAQYGLTVVTESPEYFAQELLKDYNKYGKLVKDIGYQAH